MWSYDLKGALDFFLYVFDEEDKEALTKIWLAKDVDMTLADFLKKYSKKTYLKRIEQRTQSVEEDEQAMALAASILSLNPGQEVKINGNI